MIAAFFKTNPRLALPAVVTALALAAPLPAWAESISAPQTREASDTLTPLGSYLAARHASVERDAASAAKFYRSALQADPRNSELIDRAFISAIAGGDIEEAVKFGRLLLRADKNNRVANLVVGIHELKQKKYTTARGSLQRSIRGPITDLVGTLLQAWALQGEGNASQAIALIDKLQGPEWYPIFKDLHSGLIADVAGRASDAGKRYERALKLDNSALRVVDAYGRWSSRHQDAARAIDAYGEFSKKLADHPLVNEALAQIKAGKKLPPLVTTPQAGAAEALYGLGASLSRRGGEDLALVYLQLALYLEPQHGLALLSLADLYEAIKRPQLALKVYERVPATSPLKRNAQIQEATALEGVDRADDAIKLLKDIVGNNGKDLDAIMALGNVQRARKQFAECSDTYSKALDVAPREDGEGKTDAKADTKKNWIIYYFRGICHERSKQWPKAEADLKKALAMQPEQAHVLNYLGYSWVDQGVNLDEGMKMIRRAVEQRPDDGYIVDSLGWAYYRIGQYEDAVKHLERAIELKPQDPTINDHLGDAYWRVGRTLEAKFQWAHARDLNPDPADLPKIETKLRDGMPPDEPGKTTAGGDKPGGEKTDQDKKEGKGG